MVLFRIRQITPFYQYRYNKGYRKCITDFVAIGQRREFYAASDAKYY